MEQVRTKSEKINRINRYVKSLSAQQTDVLLEQLKRNSLRDLAEKLSTAKVKSSLSMDEIVQEVKKVRKRRSRLHASK